MKYTRAVCIAVLAGFLGIYACPANAQWYKTALRNARRYGLEKRFLKPAVVSAQDLQRAVRQAQLIHPQAAPLPSGIERALLPTREHRWLLRPLKVPGTAFVIEDTYQGKKFLWGVTASHYGYNKLAVTKNRFLDVQIPFYLQGHLSANDVTVFPIPPRLASQVKPLKLAEHAPAPGEELFSISFFAGAFQYAPNRVVLEATPLRLITSLQTDPEINREGECGSPLLNQRQEVVGMHIGTSYKRNVGYAVPVENIRQILKEFYEWEQAAVPVQINHHTILQLHANQSILEIYTLRDGKRLWTRRTYHKEKELDYTQLETFIDVSQADQVALVIEQSPLIGPQNSKPRTFIITYDLHSQQIVSTQPSSGKGTM